MKLIQKAQEENTREDAYRLYLALRPIMTEKNVKSFNEFWEDIKPQKIIIDQRDTDEIMKEMQEIEDKFKREG